MYVHLPTVKEPVPLYILENPKFYPFFEDSIGMINGTYLACNLSAAEHQANHDCCSEWCPSAFENFELHSCILYQAVQLLQDSGLGVKAATWCRVQV
jgi:hypothetical protein